jgi:predicted O-methyltransferase YrrM
MYSSSARNGSQGMTVQAGLAAYLGLERYPDLVVNAVRASRVLGYDRACIPEVGMLLQVLVSSRTAVRVCETGTACGVGAAWIASALDSSSSLVTVELDAERAAVAARVLSGRPNVRTLAGDWSQLKAHGPFDLLFIDGGPDKSEWREIAALTTPRALIMFDDLTPPHAWSDEQRLLYANGDSVRDTWRRHSDFAVTEVMVTERASVLLVSRR